MTSLLHILLKLLRSSDINEELPGTLLDRVAFLAQRLPREVHFAAAGSSEEERAFKN